MQSSENRVLPHVGKEEFPGESETTPRMAGSWEVQGLGQVDLPTLDAPLSGVILESSKQVFICMESSGMEKGPRHHKKQAVTQKVDFYTSTHCIRTHIEP